MVKDNFFDRPIGAAVLFLNNFHHGKHLNDLNRCARLVPDDVRGMASLLARSPEAHDSTAKLVIDTLISWADEAEQIQEKLLCDIIVDSEDIDQ
jgi:hypothetical protein